MTEPTDGTLARYIEKFGPKDGPIIRNITFKAATLAWRWRVFLYFFCGPRERVDVLNEASGMMAKLLRDLLWNDTLMRIRQMTDPAKQKANNNLSLEHLVRIAADKSVNMSDGYAEAQLRCKLAKTYATKNLAHLDLGHALGDEISNVTRGQTTEAIRAICGFVHKFHFEFLDTDYQLMPMTHHDDEDQFLLRLYQGNQADKAFEAAELAAALAGDWSASNRGIIPPWVKETDELSHLF